MSNIYHNEKKIGTIGKRTFKSKVKLFFKKVIFWSIVIVAFAGVVQYFRWAYPTEVIVEKEVLVNQEIKYPVLDRIAMCESGNKHFDKNGQVLMRGNTGGRASVDVGVMQINVLYHGTKATELGLDLTKEKDNREYAKYLYTTRGTVDWEASRSCWNK